MLDSENNMQNEDTARLGNSDSEFTLVPSSGNHSGVIAANCISTIDELNKKIETLTQSLDNFTYQDKLHLIYDKDLHDAMDKNATSEKDDFNVKETEADRKAIKQFSGVFSVHTIYSKEGIGESKSKLPRDFKKKFQNVIGKTESSIKSKKPMLVELHSFPGYDNNILTPLPANLDALFILKVVTDAQFDLEYKALYKEIFIEFFQSQLSQDLIQDIFWWFFCHKYQSSVIDEKLFHRIATNYTKLLFLWSENRYHDKLFKEYANLMSQATYSIFCHAFPTSYRQFNSDFRDELLSIITRWMMGTKPAPQSWQSWNFTDIEPKDLRKGEKIHEEAAKAKGFEIDFKQVEERAKSSRRTSRRLSIMPLRNRRMSALPHQTKSSTLNINQSKLLHANKTSLCVPVINELPVDTESRDINKNFKSSAMTAINEVKKKKQLKTTGLKTTPEGGTTGTVNIEINTSDGGCSSTKPSTVVNNKTSKQISEKKVNEKEDLNEKMMKQISSVLGMTERKTKNYSCAVGDGPRFSKVIFDVYGRSPLVEHFLISNRLLKHAGQSIYIQRTEIAKLPSLSSETYQDVIKKAKQTHNSDRFAYLAKSKEHLKERQKCIAQRKANDRLFVRCSKKLLSNSQDVKNISDLLRLPGKEDTEDNEIRSTKLRYLIEHALENCHR